MDISADKYKSDIKRSDPSSPVLQTVRGIVSELIGFFMLTEADQLKAGVNVRGEGRDV
jgi:hypothetical protein